MPICTRDAQRKMRLRPRCSLTADGNGIARIPLNGAGLWNLRTIHIVPADRGSGADWDSHFVTFVFHVAERVERSDSAAVLGIVEQFYAALAAGDSAAALRLLHPDAVILESGGVETVAEYRGHHLPAESAFARAIPSQRTVVRVGVVGDAAWGGVDQRDSW